MDNGILDGELQLTSNPHKRKANFDDSPPENNGHYIGERKRRRAWINGVTLEESSASVLARSDDQSIALNVINFVYSYGGSIFNRLDPFENADYYKIYFDGLSSVTGKMLANMVAEIDCIKDMEILLISPTDSTSKMDKHYIELSTSVFYNANFKNKYVADIPIFNFVKYNKPPGSESKFEKAVDITQRRWTQEISTAYRKISSAMEYFYNTKEFISDMESCYFIEKDEDGGPTIYGVKIYKFDPITWSFLEGLSDIMGGECPFSFSFHCEDHQERYIKFSVCPGARQEQHYEQGGDFFLYLPKRGASRNTSKNAALVRTDNVQREEKSHQDKNGPSSRGLIFNFFGFGKNK